MVYSTMLDDLKTKIDAGSFGDLTCTVYILMKTDETTTNVKDPNQFKNLDDPLLASNEVIVILNDEFSSTSMRHTVKSDWRTYTGYIMCYAVSWNNLADLIEDLINVGTGTTDSELIFEEAGIKGDTREALYWAKIPYTWRRIVVHA